MLRGGFDEEMAKTSRHNPHLSANRHAYSNRAASHLRNGSVRDGFSLGF
jgi:hypothetical protein